MNIMKKIHRQANKIYEVVEVLLERDKNKIEKLKEDHSNEIFYMLDKMKGVKVNLILFREQPYIEEETNKEKIRAGQAVYNQNCIALNYEIFREDSIYKADKERKLRVIKHELGHLYEYAHNNDMSEEAARQYEWGF